MAQVATQSASVFQSVANAVTSFLTISTNASKIAEDVRKLNALSDEELSGLGTSRSEEIDRIFSAHAYQ
ncbi:MAG: hypothetical protein AAF340_10485 [Pseudomonadota bacterium]